MLDFLGDLKRTHMCGALRASDAGKKAVLMGWVNKRRDHGNLIFIDVRDRTGITQVVFNVRAQAAMHEKAGNPAQRVRHRRHRRGEAARRRHGKPEHATGEVELVAEELRILNESEQPPFLPGDTVLPNEEMRLKYRYIDLRRDEMQFKIETRHNIAMAIREYLSAQGFLEIETPFMTRSTPEGARDYLVPSRVQPGKFYALPQSPQLFKQILMISGFDKYFQIVRCFRDEDLRADRQPEFTQIDLEMRIPRPERVWEVVEGFLKAAFGVAGDEIETPFPRMDYDEAIRLYGIDKPDLRLPAFTDVRDCLRRRTQELAINANVPVMAIRIPKLANFRARSETTSSRCSTPRAARESTKTSSASARSIPKPRQKIAKKAAKRRRTISSCLSRERRRPGRRPMPAHRKVTPAEAGDLRVGRAAAHRAGAEVCRPARHVQEDRRSGAGLPLFVGDQLPHVRVGRGREAVDGGASSVHVAAREGHGPARSRELSR